MSNSNVALLAFSAGAIVGAAISWRYAKEKYERKASDDIRESLRQNRARTAESEEVATEVDEPTEEDEAVEYTDILKNNGYAADPAPITTHVVEKPYVISPVDFGEFEDYQRISLTCYADNVVTDTDGNVIDDVDDIIGEESLQHFGEYEDDSVFVRNDMRRCDFEILRVDENYSNFR